MAGQVEVIRRSTALGAEIFGVDLSCHMDDATFNLIHRAFIEHQVIVFRGQVLTPTQQVALANRFGIPNVFPYAQGLRDCPEVTAVIKEPHEMSNFGGEWHSDSTYLTEPPSATLLYAKETPAIGGDTLFANMYLAYDRLSKGMRELLEGLTATHTAALTITNRERRGGYASIKPQSSDLEALYAEHPVVHTHPKSGRRALYINEAHTSHFCGMTREESLPLIAYLCQQAVLPELTFRLRWEVGTIAIWDNHCTQHYAMNDYHGYRRAMYRITVTSK